VPARAPSGDHDLDALDIPTICRLAKLGRSFVYEEIRAGRLVARKFGRLTRVLKADYKAWLAAAPPILALPATCTRSGSNPVPRVPTGLGSGDFCR
jgi:excisionase family DNA binding protein